MQMQSVLSQLVERVCVQCALCVRCAIAMHVRRWPCAVCDAHEDRSCRIPVWYRERACAEVELPRVRGGWAAHKTKQAMTKHLALLASLGKLGLSEHMVLEVEADLRRQGPAHSQSKHASGRRQVAYRAPTKGFQRVCKRKQLRLRAAVE